MKREELTPIELECNMGPDVNGVVQREPWKAYDIDEVNRLLDEKDAEIAALKKKLMPCLNGDCILTCDTVEKYGKENAALKARLDTVNELVKTSKDLYDHAIESLKASHDTEMMDAGMRERRLQRALWLTRAEKAKHIAIFCYYALHYGRVPVREIYQCQDKWDNVERKCLAKAEEYK